MLRWRGKDNFKVPKDDHGRSLHDSSIASSTGDKEGESTLTGNGNWQQVLCDMAGMIRRIPSLGAEHEVERVEVAFTLLFIPICGP